MGLALIVLRNEVYKMKIVFGQTPKLINQEWV